jgi:hypothetical protein
VRRQPPPATPAFISDMIAALLQVSVESNTRAPRQRHRAKLSVWYLDALPNFSSAHTCAIVRVSHAPLQPNAAQRMTCAQLMQVMDDASCVARRTPHVT